MGKRKRAKNPLESTRTSQAFYAILAGINYPKIIAKHLDVKPPAAIQHIRRLEDIGLVKRGDKEGKIQRYDVDYDRLREIFLKYAVRVDTFQENPETGEWDPEPEDAKLVEKIQKLLKDNKHFDDLTMHYWPRVAGDCLEWEGISIYDGIRRFEDWIIWIYPEIKEKMKGRKKDKETREFLKALKLWHDRGPWIQLISLDALKDSLRELEFL